MLKNFCLLLLMVCLSCAYLAAQVNSTGILQGTVLDATGAVVPNADVKISNKDTGLG